MSPREFLNLIQPWKTELLVLFFLLGMLIGSFVPAKVPPKRDADLPGIATVITISETKTISIHSTKGQP